MKKIIIPQVSVLVLGLFFCLGSFAQTTINAPLVVTAQSSVDGKQYKLVSGKHVPYTSPSEFLAMIPNTRRHVGQIAYVGSDVYHFVNGIVDSDFVLIGDTLSLVRIGDSTCLMINGRSECVVDSAGGGGGSSGTLQNAFDAAPDASPQINTHGNDFAIDSIGTGLIKSYGEFGSGAFQVRGDATALSSHSDTLNATIQTELGTTEYGLDAIALMQGGGLGNTSTFSVISGYFAFRSDPGHPKVIIQHIDTLLSPPDQVAAFDGDTLKKYPTGGNFIPTLTALQNLTSALNIGASYIISGKFVQVTISMHLLPTSANTRTVVKFDLPLPTSYYGGEAPYGIGVCRIGASLVSTDNVIGSVDIQNSTYGTFEFISTGSTAVYEAVITFQYQLN